MSIHRVRRAVAFIIPSTSSLAVGFIVPIPTLPDHVIIIPPLPPAFPRIRTPFPASACNMIPSSPPPISGENVKLPILFEDSPIFIVSLKRDDPFTSNIFVGFVVPIPTFPPACKYNLHVAIPDSTKFKSSPVG